MRIFSDAQPAWKQGDLIALTDRSWRAAALKLVAPCSCRIRYYGVSNRQWRQCFFGVGPGSGRMPPNAIHFRGSPPRFPASLTSLGMTVRPRASHTPTQSARGLAHSNTWRTHQRRWCSRIPFTLTIVQGFAAQTRCRSSAGRRARRGQVLHFGRAKVVRAG